MQYNFRPKHWQFYVYNLSQYTVINSLHRKLNLKLSLSLDLAPHNRQSSHPKQQLQSLSPIKHQPLLGFSLKRCLALIPLLLLPYSINTQALSTTTVQVVNGNGPYLTINNGVNKITTTDELLAITLSDGTHITPKNNVSDKNPIVLPKEEDTLANIQMPVPVTVNSITLDEFIGLSDNYWSDDDGDTVIATSGTLSIDIIDNKGNKVSRSATLNVCDAPYKITLTNTDSYLITKYGIPNRRDYTDGSATYYISPKAVPTICYARPNLRRGSGNNAGPATIWSPTKGYLVQSTAPSGYNRNFPTTGANNLYFDILAGGIDGVTLTWPTVTQGGITATMTVNPPVDSIFNPNGDATVRVTLTGPVATPAQHNSNSPDSVVTPVLPQTFELVGYDSNNKAILKYGFVLKQWFVNRGNKKAFAFNHSSWCTNLGGGYHWPQARELTNAICQDSFCQRPDNDPQISIGNFNQRNIGAGLIAEWGSMRDFTDAGFVFNAYWSSSHGGSYYYDIYSDDGRIQPSMPDSYEYWGICVYP